MNDKNGWLALLEENPGHSQWYIDRFRKLAEDGADLHGEARLVDAMVPRGARILDAGCGPGRVGGYLARAGHDVTGVDLDPDLVAAARTDHPGAHWLTGDLAELDLPAKGFDVLVCAGNVMTFLAPDTRRTVLDRFADHLRAAGRAVIGFGTERGYPPEEFLQDAEAAGLPPSLLLSTWDLQPYAEGSDFLVAVLTKA
ncbi:class I SAM-dependent methyltransferase [Streptomyces sp. NPDC089919]|uniref:class I SAM-dependent methyltransferase n=1 Tax=Streptomyces sp. NPDC089919 TaxID=3155188 RepID=UPI003431A328